MQASTVVIRTVMDCSSGSVSLLSVGHSSSTHLMGQLTRMGTLREVQNNLALL